MSGSFPLRWRDLYCEVELYKAAVRVYTKPLFHWRKALSTSTDGRNLYDLAARRLRGLDALHRALVGQSFAFRPALPFHYNFNGKHLINLRFVESVESDVDDTYTVRLRNGQTVPISRRQSQRLRETRVAFHGE